MLSIYASSMFLSLSLVSSADRDSAVGKRWLVALLVAVPSESLPSEALSLHHSLLKMLSFI